EPGSPLSGRAYFVTNHDPRPLREIVLAILSAAGIEARVLPIPVRVANAAGSLLERAYRWARRDGEPPLTRFVVEQLSTAHTFDPTASRRDLGYEPSITIDEGMRRLSDALRRA